MSTPLHTSPTPSKPPLALESNHDHHLLAHDLPIQSTRTPISAIQRTAILGGILISVALVPFLITRRKLNATNRRINEMTSILAGLRQETHNLTSQMASRRDEFRRSQASIHNIMEEMEEMRAQAQKQSESQQLVDGALRSELQRSIITDRAYVREQSATFRSLGSSLASIAAFMHEAQLERGYTLPAHDARVESLREVALMLQRTPEVQASEDPASRETTLESQTAPAQSIRLGWLEP
ncbi:hypothetical protein HGRIS_009935 [Hohenbuehelia grisea]|uniref:Uncharacterized protein n=1 Tax=Hohenbuehelia grisea TaxID=104357 RepID=A0ABR3J329_9AGAR